MDGQDDIAIILALGYIALYSAYLEESMSKLFKFVKNHIEIKNEIFQYRLVNPITESSTDSLNLIIEGII